MQVYHFTEQPYFPAWNNHQGSLRVNLPNAAMDPKVAGDLFHRYYDEWKLADELGFNIMVNEHHQTATCMSSTVIVGLSVLARETKNARILVLGYPIGHRPDPLRCAEELATIDVVSRGRLDMGFIKGVPYEFPASNQNPVGVMDRFWESHDFILKAMTHQGEPFNWEGEHFHYRHVNIWPRPVQAPHPPVWTTTGSTTQAKLLGGKGYVMATLGSGYATRPLQDAYRAGYEAKWKRPAPPDRFAYLGLVATAATETEARRRGELIAGYLRSSAIVHVPFRNPPGFLSADDNAKMLRGMTPPRSFTKDGRVISMHSGSVQDLIDAGILFCGTPDQVYQQIVDFTEYCGGMGNLLMMGHAGFLNHEDTVSNLTIFAKEVMPRLKAYKQPEPQSVAA
ncbi:LLM class flavin-dependent oxidoreductase [Rhodoplanes sp. Z2-YC6860]|uniref:LLM class flavin-dependent oxidoreductase n=1 Tax=Rhodoplanes sp. Z2-YC6860 TaxID=674703 RepID=UPI00078DE5D4|nr:LLM class flavin-dependent oxidoreductase [Rhodoplanes sp. Z2-YC6860]AMN44648.1 flavin-dependent oxidoreductase, methylene-tetrahydromethanopterin reductase [Rhodoplanes sp. Z2-YC6860]